jgi:hypothetical protein
VDLQLTACGVLCCLAASEAAVNDAVAANCVKVLSSALKLGMKSSKKLSLAVYVHIECVCSFVRRFDDFEQQF